MPTLAITPTPSIHTKTGKCTEYEVYCDLAYVRQCGKGIAEVTETGKNSRK